MEIARFNRWTQTQPGRTALIYNDRAFSYAQLARSIEAARRQLAKETPSAGRVAVVCSFSLLNAWVLVTAARALGMTTVSVDSMDRARDLGLKDVGCVVVAEDEQAFLNAGVSFAGAPTIVVPSAAIHAANGLEASADLIDARQPGDYILYTSGTTGSYKKLLFDGAQTAEWAQARIALSGLSRESVFHAFSFGLWTGVGFRAPSAAWCAGGCVVIDQSDARHANFLRHAPTDADALPKTLSDLVAASDLEAAPSERLRLRVAGGFTPLTLARQVVARVSRTLLVSFSASETVGPRMMSEFGGPDDLLWLRPVDPELVQVVDESGVEAPANTEGELRLPLRKIDAAGYLDDPEATAQAFRDGCFYPGDLAIRRADGRVRILGRAADVINIKGQKRAVAPIEETLQQGLGVEEVCLLQGLAADGVEELVVAVRSTAPLDADEVLSKLGPSEIFERVRVEVFADFPRTAAGTAKTQRTELRRLVFPAAG